jgi:hypothetical protein
LPISGSFPAFSLAPESLMKRFVLIAVTVLAVAAPIGAGEIDFVEEFSLSTDRSVPLKQLIPGTEDFYYYHALHYPNSEQYQKVQELIGPWVQRHGETPRVWEIRKDGSWDAKEGAVVTMLSATAGGPSCGRRATRSSRRR